MWDYLLLKVRFFVCFKIFLYICILVYCFNYRKTYLYIINNEKDLDMAGAVVRMAL